MDELETIEDNRIRILYVDDDIVQLQYFRLKFKNEFEVITTEYVHGALEILKNDKDIDVVVSDFDMPIMNGLEFIKKARKIKNNIPFYILSSSLKTDEINEALQNQLINNFFKKPINMSHILNEIYAFYERKQVKVKNENS